MPVFRAAVAFARAYGTHLVFLYVRPDIEKLIVSTASGQTNGGIGVAELIGFMEQESLVRYEKAKAAVEAVCTQESVAMSAMPLDATPSAEWLMETGDEAQWLAAHGRIADLTVLGRLRENGSVPTDVLDAVLLDSGRPLLILPPQPPARIGQTVAIAWKDTAEAASAVAAALPILARAQRVVILSVAEDERTDAAACARLHRALLWHNRATSVQHLAATEGEPADALLRAAGVLGADLVVMGAYGHSRMREIIFGGFTRQVLQTADLPVLMAH